MKLVLASKNPHKLLEMQTILGQLGLGQVVELHQLLISLGLIDRVQVFPLQVFDQGQRSGLLVIEIVHDGRDLFPAQALGRPEAALAGNDFVAALVLADNDRLQEPFFLQGLGQLLDGIVAKSPSWLVAVRTDFR